MRTLFEKERVLFRGQPGHFGDITYEGSVAYALRFLVDKDMQGM